MKYHAPKDDKAVYHHELGKYFTVNDFADKRLICKKTVDLELGKLEIKLYK